MSPYLHDKANSVCSMSSFPLTSRVDHASQKSFGGLLMCMMGMKGRWITRRFWVSPEAVWEVGTRIAVIEMDRNAGKGCKTYFYDLCILLTTSVKCNSQVRVIWKSIFDSQSQLDCNNAWDFVTWTMWNKSPILKILL